MSDRRQAWVVRLGFLAVCVAGLVALAGCGDGAEGLPPPPAAPVSPLPPAPAPPPAPEPESAPVGEAVEPEPATPGPAEAEPAPMPLPDEPSPAPPPASEPTEQPVIVADDPEPTEPPPAPELPPPSLPSEARLAATAGAEKDYLVTHGSARVEISDGDQALVESVVLQLGDFPTGWRAVAESDDPEDDTDLVPEECIGERADLSDVTITGLAISDEFQRELGATNNSVYVLAEEDHAEMVYTLFSQVLTDCFSEVAEVDETISDVSVGQLSFPDFGDESTAYGVRMQFEDPQSEFSAPVLVDFVFVRSDRVVALMSFGSLFAQPDPALEEMLVEAVAGRMG